ncbi:MAG: hypothetical protein PHP08_03015 [Candidatus Dojkabacteria bacterium]|nr:hypothetical protein [Candidatus Dojkabacteria bacterium]
MNGLIISETGTNTLSDTLSGNISSDGGVFNGDVTGIDGVVDVVTKIALPLAGTAAVILLIIAGYKMITSRGNPDKLTDAKEMATNAIIGLVFILLSVAILGLISSVFNLDIVGN